MEQLTHTPTPDAVSGTIEYETAREPVNSNIRTMLLAGAGLSIAASMIMQMNDRKNDALFVGQWAPTLIAIALWYQIVKAQRL